MTLCIDLHRLCALVRQGVFPPQLAPAHPGPFGVMSVQPPPPSQGLPTTGVVPQRQWLGIPLVREQERQQWFSDSLFSKWSRWQHAAMDAVAPTLLLHKVAKGASPKLTVWVGPVDVALDDLWMRELEAAHIFEICESGLRRRESFATAGQTFANLKWTDRSRTSSPA